MRRLLVRALSHSSDPPLPLTTGALLCNAVAWVALPAARRLRLWSYNVGVRRRNVLRRQDAARLNEPLPPAALRRRLRAARTFGTRGRLSVTAGRDALYTTAKSLLEQAEAQDPVGSAWEEKLRERSG